MKRVQVLLSTYNGEKYLKEQLDSILNQKEINISVLIRDDGSTDSTINILKNYEELGKIKCIYGKNLGYAKSFFELLNIADNSDFYAFADQDDIWEDDKLISAVKQLDKINNKLKLYFSALEYVDENLKFIKIKDYKNFKISIGNAISRTRIAGCTMVFSEDLLNLYKCSGLNRKCSVSHDDLIYMLCLCSGGDVICDNTPHIKYRRHGSNATVTGNGIYKRIKREFSRLKKNKDYKINLANYLLDNYAEIITIDNYNFLNNIKNYKISLINTIKLLFNFKLRCGIPIVDIYNRVLIIFRAF